MDTTGVREGGGGGGGTEMDGRGREGVELLLLLYGLDEGELHDSVLVLGVVESEEEGLLEVEHSTFIFSD